MVRHKGVGCRSINRMSAFGCKADVYQNQVFLLLTDGVEKGLVIIGEP